MNWLLLAVIGQFALGTSAVFDKVLLKKKFFNPWVYTFWAGIMGIVSIILLPFFGLSNIGWQTILIALLSGFIFDISVLLLFSALDEGEASWVFPLNGGLLPVFTFTFACLLLNSKLLLSDFVGFAILVFGGLLFVFTEKKETKTLHIFMAILAAVFLGLSDVLLKMSFNGAPFFPAFIWSRIGGVLFVLLFLLIPKIRREIISSFSHPLAVEHRYLYFGNRIYAGLAAVALYFSMSLAHPALIDATQSFKYVVIFFTAWFFLGEKFSGKVLIGKSIATLFIIAGLSWLGFSNYINNLPVDMDREIVWGVTFSDKFSRQMGLDWKKNFEATLHDLRPEKMRLVAYWDQIEKEKNVLDFSNLDWQMQKASGTPTKIILAIGMKTPRWPECNMPEWAEDMETEEREASLRNFLAVAVSRYKDHPSLLMWQVENEPHLIFGECPTRGDDFLEREIFLVREIDGQHKILTTDGGEMGLWYPAASRGDVFGTTMYRKVMMRGISQIWGAVEYPFTPNYFRIKKAILKFFPKGNKEMIVIELQSEPWGKEETVKMSYAEQMENFGFDYFKETIEYAKKADYSEYYLWGVEWWYWLKEKKGDNRFWNEARNLIKSY